MKTKLVQKIVNRDIVVGVVGLGYVGLPLAVEKAKAGFKTIGFDVQEEKVNLVNEGHNYIGDVVDSDLKKLVEAGMLSATTDFSFGFYCDLCADTVGQASAAGHQLCQEFDNRDCKIYDERHYGSFGIHYISGNDRRTNQTTSGRRLRSEMRGGFLSGILSGTG